MLWKVLGYLARRPKISVFALLVLGLQKAWHCYILNMFGNIAFLLHRRFRCFRKKCLGLLLTSIVTVIVSLTQTYQCRFPTCCLKKVAEPWDSSTFVILALKSFSQIYKSIAKKHEKPRASKQVVSERSWTSHVVPIRSSCPHDLGVTSWVLCSLGFRFTENHFEIAALLIVKFWEHGWTFSLKIAPWVFHVSKHFSWHFPKRQQRYGTTVVWNNVVWTLDKLQLKEARRWGFFSDKSLVVCSLLARGPFFGGGLLTVGIVVFLLPGHVCSSFVKDWGDFLFIFLSVDFEHFNRRPFKYLSDILKNPWNHEW